jgi:flagellar hook-basal body complex protein FliE
MSPVSSVYSSLVPQAMARADALREKQPAAAALATLPDSMRAAPPAANGFGEMLGSLVDTVGAKQAEATQLTQKALLGETDQLHQSVIAMQEASVAFSLMVEVRNKLVESYQELMRMQV